MKSVSTQDLQNFESITLKNNKDLKFSNVQPSDDSNSESLVFISTVEMLKTSLIKKVRGFIILEKIYSQITTDYDLKNCLVYTTPNIQWAMSEILHLFDRNKNIHVETNVTIHPTAIISPTASIGKNVSICAYAIIADFAVIQDFVHIGPHCVVEHHATIKEKTFLASHVFIGSYCEIGKNCNLASHVVIGSDGFGYFTDKNFNHHKIPQIGIVRLEDNVEMGAHCAVDRATLNETKIKSGSKFDNHCHIAHNVEIGENAIAAAAFKVAGSTKIGKNLMTSGGIDINGHITVSDNVILTARAGLTKSIEAPGIYGGFPAMEHKENLKVLATIPHLPKIKKQIAQIMKHLGLEK